MWKVSFLVAVLLLMGIACESKEISQQCEEKEKSLALLDLAKDSISKAKMLIPQCDEIENKTHENQSACGQKEKSSAYIDVALQLIREAEKSYPTCNSENVVEPDKEKPEEEPLAADCLDVLQSGKKKSGIYTIQIFNSTASINQTLNVFCDMDTDGGGWTVIQRRANFSVQEDFNRDWLSYRNGFGNVSKDFWIGNEIIHALTNEGSNNLRVDLGDAKGEKAFALYKDFVLTNEADGYRLKIGGYSGNAGDSLTYSNDAQFSTKDKINGGVSTCPASCKAAWWFKNCAYSNLNGIYRPDETAEWNNYWDAWRNRKGLAFSEMKIRRLK